MTRQSASEDGTTPYNLTSLELKLLEDKYSGTVIKGVDAVILFLVRISQFFRVGKIHQNIFKIPYQNLATFISFALEHN